MGIYYMPEVLEENHISIQSLDNCTNENVLGKTIDHSRF